MNTTNPWPICKFAVSLEKLSKGCVMADLGRLLNDANLGQLGKDVWLIIAGYMDMRSACRFASTCRAGKALLHVDAHNERRFAREKTLISVVRTECRTWLERFRTAEACATLEEAVDLQDSIRAIILCPGVHTVASLEEHDDDDMPEGISIVMDIDILGCCFNQDYNCISSAIRHTEEVPKFGPVAPNIVITCATASPIGWHAPGGHIRNVEVRFETSDPEYSQVGLVVGPEGMLEAENCGFSSSQHTGLVLDDDAKLIARGCRFHHCQLNGLSFLAGEANATVVCEGCSFDNNGICGAEVTDGMAELRNCIAWGNRFNGIGLNGPGSTLMMERCNVFSNGLNGVDVTPSAQGGSIKDCNIERNWRGVRVYSPDTSCVVLSECNVSDNVQADVVVKQVEKVADLVAAADAEGVCTFVATGPHYASHEIVKRCLTCLTPDLGCCLACVNTCHKGHQIEEWEEEDLPLSFFCDCAIGPACHFSERVKDDIIGRKARNQ